MIAEKLLTRTLRPMIKRSLKVQPVDLDALPGPLPGRDYLLYIHIPFCERLCPYCSFNRFPFQAERARSYFQSLRSEMHLARALGYTFPSLYIGGGTPTVLIDELCTTIDLARDLFDIEEVSCETNPNHLTPEVAGQLTGRVQRLSVGIQSFDDGLLQQMQRYDKYGSGEQILNRLESVAGQFPTLNADMIFNFPSQTQEILQADVESIIASAVNQVTFYALMTSPSVARSMKKTVGAVSYAREAAYYQILSEGLSRAFEPVSAWCFARRGGEMIDEYIVDYEEYVGLGSGSFSHLDGALYVNTFSLADYQARIASGRMAVSQFRPFDLRERMRYRFMMDLFGLRLDKRRFRQTFNCPIERGLWLEMAFMRLAGAFEQDNERWLTLTDTGRYLLVVMMREFFANLNEVRDTAREAISSRELTELFGQ